MSSTIQNVTVQDSLRSGIDLNGLSGGLVDNVTLTGNGGVGLALTDSSLALGPAFIRASARVVSWARTKRRRNLDPRIGRATGALAAAMARGQMITRKA